MKNWEAAIEDASTCVAKDPSFIKGYYRLATAYTEIGNYDDALNVLQTALTKEPGDCGFSSLTPHSACLVL
jgi:tetratricopeptide (TPR) repeat protein